MKEKLDNPEKLKRKYNVQVMFNELEMNAILRYCKKYKVTNRSKLIRESVISSILKKFDEDYPSLFDQEPQKNGQTFDF